jgi:hypothetical protein
MQKLTKYHPEEKHNVAPGDVQIFSAVPAYVEAAGVARSVYRPGYGLDNRGSIPGRGKDGIYLSSPPHPDRLWGTLSFLSNGYRGILPPG